jgi:hypothetical protein
MPLRNLFADSTTLSPLQRQKLLYQQFGVISNPFLRAAQIGRELHMATAADDQVDRAVKTFYDGRKSQAIAITASQGIGKTNLYERLRAGVAGGFGSAGLFCDSLHGGSRSII